MLWERGPHKAHPKNSHCTVQERPPPSSKVYSTSSLEVKNVLTQPSKKLHPHHHSPTTPLRGLSAAVGVRGRFGSCPKWLKPLPSIPWKDQPWKAMALQGWGPAISQSWPRRSRTPEHPGGKGEGSLAASSGPLCLGTCSHGSAPSAWAQLPTVTLLGSPSGARCPVCKLRPSQPHGENQAEEGLLSLPPWDLRRSLPGASLRPPRCCAPSALLPPPPRLPGASLTSRCQ